MIQKNMVSQFWKKVPGKPRKVPIFFGIWKYLVLGVSSWWKLMSPATAGTSRCLKINPRVVFVGPFHHVSPGPLVKHHLCHGQKSRFVGDGRPPTFNDGILISWVYKPLLLGWWVYPLLYGNTGSLDPGTCVAAERFPKCFSGTNPQPWIRIDILRRRLLNFWRGTLGWYMRREAFGR